jgi:hypothetical protein
VLVTMDYFTKWMKVVSLKNMMHREVIQLILEHIIPSVDVEPSDILMRIGRNANTQDQSQERHSEVETGLGPLEE